VNKMLARCFYHNPRYACLDECTSAVSVDAEETLYRLASERGITCITVSQTMTLPEFHQQELRIGVNTPDGWSLHDVDQGLRNSVASDSGFGTVLDGGRDQPVVAEHYSAPARLPVADDPALPRVLLLGDSVSLGYTLAVRSLLAGIANVHRPINTDGGPNANCGPTVRGVESVSAWLSQHGSRSWDVVHFNFGLQCVCPL
jgi:hypothetical protein